MKKAVMSKDRWSVRFGDATERFARDPPVRKEKKPLREEDLFDSHCPYCHQHLDRPSLSITSLLTGGIRQLGVALLMIAFAIVRCLRFAAAAALCVIGFVGSCCRALGMQVAHAEDRQFLKKL